MGILIRLWMCLYGFFLAIVLVLLVITSSIKWIITGKKLPSKYLDWIIDRLEEMEGNE